MSDAPPTVATPFPIFLTAGRYLLYDINTISYLRREHHIIGVLIGGLPQAPQQNVFLGIPLELMPEEACLLVEKGVSYIVDDAAAHKQGFLGRNGLSEEEKKAFQNSLARQGSEAARRTQDVASERKKDALKKIVAKQGNASGDWNDIPEDMLLSSVRGARGKKKHKARGREVSGPLSATASASATPAELSRATTPNNAIESQTNGVPEEEESLFGSAPVQIESRQDEPSQPEETLHITPTTSYPPLTSRPPSSQSNRLPLPDVPSSYPLFRHLHENDYFLAPGLRFGCQYMAYPGDPLRFHSHFLCNGMDWDEEFELLDLVGGGRLGTGVKKGFLIGGQEKSPSGASTDKVRTFCIEWGGM